MDWSLFVLNQKNRACKLNWASFCVCLMVCLVPAGPANATLTSSAVFSFDLTTNSGGVVESNGFLFGTLTNTSLSYGGAIYKVSVNGGAPETIYQLKSTDGYSPVAGLLVGSDGYLYGSTVYGARRTVFNLQDGVGTLFRVKQGGSGFETLHRFDANITTSYPVVGNAISTTTTNPDGLYPSFPLIEDSVSGCLYGVTSIGGSNGTGIVFRIKKDGLGFEVIHEFSGLNTDGSNAEGAYPNGALLLASDGRLYGVTKGGGSKLYTVTNNTVSPSVITTKGTGTVYSIDPANKEFRVVHYFDELSDQINTDSAASYLGQNSTGAFPYGGLLELEGSPGVIVGAAADGGLPSDLTLPGLGVIYKLKTDGTEFSLLHSFDVATGYSPIGTLVQKNNTLYGVHASSASVFSYNIDTNTYQVESLSNAAVTASPNSGLYLSLSRNDLFGTTGAGGGCGYGNVYRVSLDGVAAPPGSNYSNCYIPAASSGGGGSMDKTSLWVLFGLAALVSVRRRVFGFC